MTPTQMGRRLKQLREARDLSRQELAERADISREYLRRLEAGRQDPTVGTLQRLAKALGVKVTKLLE
jgi:transcriptional regulator with XRE-family HTH domain